MRIVVWNCRGLGNGPAVRGLLELQKQVDPGILFLSETKMDENRMLWFKSVLRFPNMVVRKCEGRSGGLVIFWRSHINATLFSFSRYHIDIGITKQDGFKWRFTGIYGEPATEKRERTWKLLRILKERMKLPWLCAGDFNEIMYGNEKRGGPPRNRKLMENFRMALADCGLRDLGCKGDKFTWRNNSHNASNYIKERLDRAVATKEWCNRFPAYTVVNGDPGHSDHKPLTIQVEASLNYLKVRNERNKFRFEARWLDEEDCETIVNNAWGAASALHECNVAQILQKIATDLKDWDQNVLGDLQKRIKQLKKSLEEVRRGDINQERVNREHFLKEKLERLEQQLNTQGKQRAHVKWLQAGDKNTSFFHAFASDRKKRNTIKRLKREDGVWIENTDHLKQHITDYFFSIFSSAAGESNNEEILKCSSAKSHGTNE